MPACDTVVAAAAPDHAIARGRAGAGLLAHIVVSKYDDHLPLYRQAEIYAREGASLETSTLSGWVGATAPALAPLVDALAAEVTASDTLHVDDTPVPVLAPGSGKTKTGRLWVYVRDEPPFAGAHPPAALFRYSVDRKGEHPRVHPKDFTGVIHADGYAGIYLLGYRSDIAPSRYCAAATLARAGIGLSSRSRGITSIANSVILATVSAWSRKPPWPNINRLPKPPTLSCSALIWL